MQSRYYDPELGRFINADAFTSTGQGLLGNNMFAYCGNNPVSRYDPSGTDYDSTIARKQFFYCEITKSYGGIATFYPGGVRSLSSNSNVAFQDAATYALSTVALSAVAILCPPVAVGSAIIGGLDNYFYCRDAGLDPVESSFGALLTSAISFIPISAGSPFVEAVVFDSMLSFSSDVVLEKYVSFFLDDPVEASRNQIQFRTTLGAVICVGGTARYTNICHWDMGGDMFAWLK